MRRPDGTTEVLPPPDEAAYQRLVRTRRVTPTQRQRVLARDLGACRYCQEDADCIDHVVPLALGGTNATRNLVAACTPCNGRKGRQVWTPTPADKHRHLVLARGGHDDPKAGPGQERASHPATPLPTS